MGITDAFEDFFSPTRIIASAAAAGTRSPASHSSSTILPQEIPGIGHSVQAIVGKIGPQGRRDLLQIEFYVV